jgi:hypothetical protein
MLALVTAASIAVATAAVAADAPPPKESIVNELVDNAVRSTRVAGLSQPFARQVSAGNEGLLIAYLIALESELPYREAYRTLLHAMDARVDTQTGSTPNNSGTTSVAMKGRVPEILGFAVENGAITRAVDGTTVTFRATPTGVVEALRGKGLLDIYTDYTNNTGLRYVARLSTAVSFDTSRGTTTPTLTADVNQLSSWSVRYEVANGRDAASPAYASLWATLASKSGSPYVAARERIENAVNGWPAFTAWRGALEDDVTKQVDTAFAADRDLNGAIARFRNVVATRFTELVKLDRPRTVTAALDEYVAQLTALETSMDQIYKYVSKGILATIDWTTTRDVNTPDLYTITGVYEDGYGPKRDNEFTFNAALSFYRTAPAGATHQLKKFDAAAQYDRPLGNIATLPFVLSLSLKLGYLPNDVPMADGSAATAPKGGIVIAQGKLTIPIKGSGAKIPISVTYANRSELIMEHDVRANFGVTFDFDSTLARAFGR